MARKRKASEGNEVFQDLKDRGLLAGGMVDKVVEEGLKQDPSRKVVFIPTFGVEDEYVVCRKCHTSYPTNPNRNRVNSRNGFHFTANKQCPNCAKKSSKSTETLRKECHARRKARSMAPKPRNGEKCPRCKQPSSNWHFHHVEGTPKHDYDNEYVCSVCNMQMDNHINPGAH